VEGDAAVGRASARADAPRAGDPAPAGEDAAPRHRDVRPRGVRQTRRAGHPGDLVSARRRESWDATVGVLVTLDAEHPEFFHCAMRGCRRLSNCRPERNGLDALLPGVDQLLFDVAGRRDGRRERQGYVTPAQARTFLQMSRDVRLDHAAPPSPNPIARAR